TDEITETDTIIAATGHQHVNKNEAKAATCSEAGNIGHWYCADCGKYFSDEGLTDEITETDTIIAATGHQHVNKSEAKAATCSEAGSIEHWYCADCGKYFSDEELTDEITETDTIIAATGSPVDITTTPETGNNSNLTLWIILLLLSCSGMAMILIYGKKEKCN
ncbi:MAG: hypothetical protein HFE78_04315, partial [Clostridiales bacterium]|nr:hypothetical protein [Clostridiales bacterium]